MTPEPLPVGTSFTPLDVHAGLTDVGVAYQDAFGKSPLLRAIYIGQHNVEYGADGRTSAKGCELEIDQVPGEDDSWVRAAFLLPVDATVGDDPGWTTHNRHRWKVVLPTTPERALPPMLPPLGQIRGDDSVFSRDIIFAREPLHRGIALTTLSLLFAISYMTGMLVRYYPTHWRSFLNREKGDAALPALRAAMRVVDKEFPLRVLESAVSLISEPGAPVFPAFVPQAQTSTSPG